MRRVQGYLCIFVALIPCEHMSLFFSHMLMPSIVKRANQLTILWFQVTTTVTLKHVESIHFPAVTVALSVGP